MLSFRRWLDRKRDRRPVIRISRGAYRRRAWWRRWPLAIIALLLILLAALCAPLLVSEPASTARVVTISHASAGGLLLDGAPVSPTLLETRLKALRREPDGVAAVLTKPDPRAEAILNRQGIGWVSPSDGGEAIMAASMTSSPGGPNGSHRRKRSPITFGRVLAVVGVGLVLVIGYTFMSKQTVSDRPNEMKTTTVILPPPPPPPPPPEPKPIEQPPEPTVAPPIDQPMDTPPPPDASNDPVQGDNALTAREGAGPSSYGLAVGDGGGARIGGRPGGGDAFAAYAAVALNGVRQAAQGDRELSRGRYTVRLAVTVNPEGRITNVRVIEGGDERRNARLREVLTGLQLSQRPPAGLPVMRIELNARSGA